MRLTVLITVAAVTIVAGCSSAWEPEGPPMMTGSIVARDVGNSFGAPNIHVKESAGDQCGIIFKVTVLTPIRRRLADGRTERASLSDLTVGTQVNVWADIVLESCPGQSEAEGVEIITSVND